MAGPVGKTGDGVVVSIRLAPGARNEAIAGLAEGVDGGSVLKAPVTAPPEGGKTNRALIYLLSRSRKLPRGRFSLVSGAASRNKRLLISGDPEELAKTLERRTGADHG